MRLKSLRKERPAFEIEGAVINGNRMDLSKNDLKPTKHRSNTSFALPTSLNLESSHIILPLSDRTDEMNNRSRSRQQVVIPTGLQPSNLPSYQAIEAACLEHGIRIRLSPTRTTQQSGRKSVNSLQRHTAFINRNPSRTSSVLHYATTNLEQHHDSRPFSVLQQASSIDFDPNHAHNVSYAQSPPINEETHENSLSPSIVVSEHSNVVTSIEKVPITNDMTSTTTLLDNDPDLVYMSSLLKQSSGDSFIDTIRRRAGLRGTFSVHRNTLTSTSFQSRDKSPNTNRSFVTHTTTIPIAPPLLPSANKINKDILKHASRIRRISPSKDFLMKSPRKEILTKSTISLKQNSTNKPLKSFSLEPLEFLLTPTRSASISTHDLPSIKSSTKSRKQKTSIKRTKSAKISKVENENSMSFISTEPSTYASVLYDESLDLMRTSPLDMARQTNSFDSGCYERSSSSVDLQSLTSSSIIQNPSSIPSARLTNSAARRSNTNKRVSFYEEPSTIILTTATYV